MARKRKKGGGRLQSWFGSGVKSYNAARKALSERKKAGIEHKLAKIVKKRTGEVQYYVGQEYAIKALKKRFDVELKG